MRLSPGDIVAGGYRLEALLGSGSSGSVWKCTDLSLGRTVALKVLHAELLRDPGQAERFRREARLLATLDHPGVVSIFASLTIEDELGRAAPAIVMPYLPGETLADVLRSEGAFAPARALRILLDLLDALAAAHAIGVVHRDLKPHNVLLERRAGGAHTGSNREVVRLLDFGIARSATAPATASSMLAAQVGLTLGTPAYISPEQVANPTAVDARADLWAAAVCLYELLSGALPFEGESSTGVLAAVLSGAYLPVTQRRASLPASFDRFFARAFARELARRPVDAAAMARDLEALLAEVAAPSVREGFAPATPTPRPELSKATIVGHALGPAVGASGQWSSPLSSASAPASQPSLPSPPLRSAGAGWAASSSGAGAFAAPTPPVAPHEPLAFEPTSPAGALAYVRPSLHVAGNATQLQASQDGAAAGYYAAAAEAPPRPLIVPARPLGVVRVAAFAFAVTLLLGGVALGAYFLVQL